MTITKPPPTLFKEIIKIEIHNNNADVDVNKYYN